MLHGTLQARACARASATQVMATGMTLFFLIMIPLASRSRGQLAAAFVGVRAGVRQGGSCVRLSAAGFLGRLRLCFGRVSQDDALLSWRSVALGRNDLSQNEILRDPEGLCFRPSDARGLWPMKQCCSAIVCSIEQ